MTIKRGFIPFAPVVVLLSVLSALLFSQDTHYPPRDAQIPGPDTPRDFSRWLADLEHWRQERRIRIGYEGSEYSRPELEWTQTNFVLSHVMIEERTLYDPGRGQYTVGRFLERKQKEFGGVDSVLIWHTYPNLGIDNRNQFDRLRDMPGGLNALRECIAEFHRQSVRVLFPETPWDQGTRDEGAADWVAQARLMAEIGADGLLGDTLDGAPHAFRIASDNVHHPLALQPEGLPPDEALAWNNMTWGYWRYPYVPMISRYKWLEPRHRVIVTGGDRDRRDALQAVFFNGVGYADQEDVLGVHNPFTELDAEALRRIAKIERAFPDLLVGPRWEPHTPTLQYGVFASKFPGDKLTLWTLINRNEYDVSGPQLEIKYEPGTRYYDLWHGVELQPEIEDKPRGLATLLLDLESRGFAAVLAREEGAPAGRIEKLLGEMRALAGTPLGALSRQWAPLPQRLQEIPQTRPARAAPPGMVLIPAADFDFRVAGVEIAGGNEAGIDVQYPWEDAPRRTHRHAVSIRPFFIDRFPVTNAEFARFLEAAHYHPTDDHNFLRDWRNDRYPSGWANKPVAWVSLEDARAYAAWAGKRLPHEWEWQYAAQGNDGRLYPWGNAPDTGAVPTPGHERTLRGPDDVTAHPAGASPFGVMDLVGNVWQWTDEFVDEHTRAAVLRGGSYYQPQGSTWYFPQARRLDEHGKYLLMAPSIDRSGTIGFRCVVDAE